MRLVVVALSLWSCGDPNGPAPASVTILGPDRVEKIPGYDVIGPGYIRVTWFDFTVERNGYDGGVSVTVDAPPPITAEVSTSSGAEPISVSLGIDAPNETPAGDYTVTLRVTQADGRVATKDVIVHVVPFALALMPPKVTISQGAAIALHVSVKGAVPTSVTTSGAPPGVTINASTTFLDITAAPDAAPGTSTITLAATKDNVSDSRTFSLVVQPPRPKRPVSFNICWGRDERHDFNMKWYFANDGEPWRVMAPDAGRLFTIDATDHLSIAETVEIFGSEFPATHIRIVNLTAAELERMRCAPSTVPKTETYTATVTGSAEYSIALGSFRSVKWNRSGDPPGACGATPPLCGNGEGAFDLVASALRADGSFAGVIRRDQDYADKAEIPVDFTGPEAFVLDSAAHGFTANAGEQRTVIAHLHTPNTIAALLPFPSSQAGDRYYAVPIDHLEPDDMQSISAAAVTHENLFTVSRGVVRYFRAASTLSLSAGPPIAEASIDTTARTFLLPSQAEYAAVAGIRQRVYYDSRGRYTDVEVWQTKAFAGGTPATWTFTMPDPGRTLFVEPMRGGPTSLTSLTPLLAAAGGGDAVLYFGAQPADGATLRWAAQMGRFLPFPAGR